MKITVAEISKTMAFGDLSLGDVFEYLGNIYLVVYSRVSCGHVAICLSSNNYCDIEYHKKDFAKDEMVNLCDAELIVKK